MWAKSEITFILINLDTCRELSTYIAKAPDQCEVRADAEKCSHALFRGTIDECNKYINALKDHMGLGTSVFDYAKYQAAIQTKPVYVTDGPEGEGIICDRGRFG